MIKIFQFFIYRFKVWKELRYIIILLGKKRGGVLEWSSEVNNLVRNGFNNGWSELSTSIKCAGAVIEIIVQNMPENGRQKIISELPLLNWDLYKNINNDFWNNPEQLEIYMSLPFLPGTIAIGFVIYVTGVLLFTNKISPEERDVIMEQIYGILHNIPTEKRMGKEYNSIFPNQISEIHNKD